MSIGWISLILVLLGVLILAVAIVRVVPALMDLQRRTKRLQARAAQAKELQARLKTTMAQANELSEHVPSSEAMPQLPSR